MADLWTIQSNLNRGVLDPLILGRVDLNAYYNGVQTGTNVLSIPQGGMKKRPGTEFLDETLGDGRIESFEFSTEQTYCLAFSNLKMEIFKDGVLQTNINGSGNDYLDIPWTLAQILEFDYIQSADTIIITHPDVQTRTITRTSDTTWTIATAPFTNIPQYDFNDASSPTPVAEVQTLTFTNKNEGDRYKLALEGLLTEEITWAADDATNHENIEVALQALINTGNSGIGVSTSVSLSVYIVTFSGDSANAWNLLTGTAVSTQSASFQIAAARTQAGTSRKEDSWSSTRGWPTTCTFHEGRLWFGGSKSRPSALFGSRSFDFYNFDTGRALDDEAIDVTLDTDQVNAIQAVFSNRSLQVFTTGGEFYVPQSPATPQTISVVPQSNIGTYRIRPVTIDGVTLFAQKTGKAIMQFVYLDEYQANQTRSVSVLSPGLINTPIKLSAARGTEESDANYVYMPMDDGTMTVFNTLAAEDVAGFTKWTTTGDIKSAAVVDNVLYLLVERSINGSTVYHLERENSDYQTDATVVDTTTDDDITGLDHLEGEAVWAKADGAFMGEYTVSSGEITITRESSDKEAGLEFIPTITTMPLNVNLENGPSAFAKKKIARVGLQLYQSNGVIVNGQRIADKTIGVDQFDPPSPRTGEVRMHLLGWSLEAQVTITQDTPMPMTILNIGTEVSV